MIVIGIDPSKKSTGITGLLVDIDYTNSSTLLNKIKNIYTKRLKYSNAQGGRLKHYSGTVSLITTLLNRSIEEIVAKAKESGHKDDRVLIMYEHMLYGDMSSPLQFLIQEAILSYAEKMGYDCYGFSIGFVKKIAKVISNPDKVWPRNMQKEDMFEALDIFKQNNPWVIPDGTSIVEYNDDEVDSIFIALGGALLTSCAYPFRFAIHKVNDSEYISSSDAWKSIHYYYSKSYASDFTKMLTGLIYVNDEEISLPLGTSKPDTEGFIHVSKTSLKELHKDIFNGAKANKCISGESLMTHMLGVQSAALYLTRACAKDVPPAGILAVIKLMFGASDIKAKSLYKQIRETSPSDINVTALGNKPPMVMAQIIKD